MQKIIFSDERYGRKSYHLVDDDFIDRLNNRVTILGLVMSIFIITGDMYVGKPINCWTPAEFKGQHDSYTNSICWLKGSYYLPTEEITIPDRSKPRIHFVSYYQWTPFILLGMGGLFLIPRILWTTFTRLSGLNLVRIMQTVKEKPDSITHAKSAIKRYLDTQNSYHSAFCCGFRLRNVYVSYTVAYFIIKLLYLINSLVQFILLHSFLSFNFKAFHSGTINNIFSGIDILESPRFPRVTMCDFMIRRLGSNQHWYSVQCNLPINMYNEKIFFAIWIWLIVLIALNTFSILRWIISLSKRRRFAVIKRFLRLHQLTKKNDAHTESSSNQNIAITNIRDFSAYLHTDGFLIFRIISRNSHYTMAADILHYLYQHYTPRIQPYTSDV